MHTNVLSIVGNQKFTLFRKKKKEKKPKNEYRKRFEKLTKIIKHHSCLFKIKTYFSEYVLATYNPVHNVSSGTDKSH